MFEGKVITLINPIGKSYKARVVACVKDVGITIVNDENPNHYLYCLKMKNAPNFYKAKGEITATRKAFTQVRKEIIKGTVDRSNKISRGRASHATCPFGQ